MPCIVISYLFFIPYPCQQKLISNVLQMLMSKFLYNNQKAELESLFLSPSAYGKKSIAGWEAGLNVICFTDFISVFLLIN